MIRDAYFEAAEAAATLFQAPELAARWREPSALAGFTVAGLAFHLASQVTNGPAILAERTEAEPIPLLDYYTRSPWLGSGADSEANTQIRLRGEEAASDATAPDLIAQYDEALKLVRAGIAETPAGIAVTLRGRALSLDDYLYTRTLELTIHADDLAASLGIEVELPPAAAEATIALLARISTWRHGATAVLRALSRSERAPASICAL